MIKWNETVDVNYLDDQMIHDILCNLDMDKDHLMDGGLAMISNMSAREAFTCYLNWNGIIGWTEGFVQVINSLEESQKEEPVK